VRVLVVIGSNKRCKSLLIAVIWRDEKLLQIIVATVELLSVGSWLVEAVRCKR